MKSNRDLIRLSPSPVTATVKRHSVSIHPKALMHERTALEYPKVTQKSRNVKSLRSCKKGNVNFAKFVIVGGLSVWKVFPFPGLGSLFDSSQNASDHLRLHHDVAERQHVL